MSSFTESNLIKKLSELNGTQQSIQTLSLWLIHHRKRAKEISHVWHKMLLKVPSPKRLTFMYLANDVIQNSKKKGPELSREFGKVLLDAFKVSMRDADEKMKTSLGRILNIWEERTVYTADFIKQVKQATAGNSSHEEETVAEPSPRKKKRKEEPAKLPVSMAAVDVLRTKMPEPEEPEEEIEHVDADDLVKKLSDLENSASSDATVREKIAALPPEVSDISQLGKIQDKDTARRLSSTVDEACVLLSEYNKRLNEELEDRKGVAKMLKGFILTQREQLEEAEKRLTEYKEKLAKVTSVRQELKSHLQNLPDLTLLPDVTGGLAPLPSAGDLFH